MKSRKCSKVKPLVYENKLDDYCWESTESMIVFFENAYIVRGYLNQSKTKRYYHSWLVITYNGELYVFDPTANIIVLKRDFDAVFRVEELVNIPSKLVHDELINILEGKVKEYTPNFGDKEINEAVAEFGKFLSSFCVHHGQSVPYSNDINAPFYRNASAYIGEVENNKIKSLRVHFYDYDT